MEATLEPSASWETAHTELLRLQKATAACCDWTEPALMLLCSLKETKMSWTKRMRMTKTRMGLPACPVIWWTSSFFPTAPGSLRVLQSELLPSSSSTARVRHVPPAEQRSSDSFGLSRRSGRSSHQQRRRKPCWQGPQQISGRCGGRKGLGLDSQVYTVMDPKLHEVVVQECAASQVEGRWDAASPIPPPLRAASIPSPSQIS